MLDPMPPSSLPGSGASDATSRRRARLVRRALLFSVAGLVIGNLAIVATMALVRSATTAPDAVPTVHGVDRMRTVDDRLLRGDAPSDEGYADLAAQGVTTVVDLRAERDISVPEQRLETLGIGRVHLPVRDGQVPSQDQVRRFIEVVRGSEGRVFVHCGAGVGRTGTMAGAWLVENNGAGSWEALARNLAVGPPSLEQIVYVAGLGEGGFSRPSPVVTAVSRVLDGPRRIWSRLAGGDNQDPQDSLDDGAGAEGPGEQG